MINVYARMRMLATSPFLRDRLLRTGMIGRFETNVEYAIMLAQQLSKENVTEGLEDLDLQVGSLWDELEGLKEEPNRRGDISARVHRDDLESIRWALERSKHVNRGDLDHLFLELDKFGAKLPPLVQEPMEDIPNQLLWAKDWWRVTEPTLSPLKRVAKAYLSRVEDPGIDGEVDLTSRDEREGWESRGKKGDLEAIEEALRIFTSTD